jgi:hypothetical protein
MAFFLELSEGAITGQGKIPDETLTAEHINNYTAAFMGMDAAMIKLPIHSGTQTADPVLEEDEDDKCLE